MFVSTSFDTDSSETHKISYLRAHQNETSFACDIFFVLSMVFLEVIHDSICTKMGEAGLHWLLSRRKFAMDP